MKKMLLLNCFCLLAFYFSPAQQTDYKVVFDLTSKDTLSHQTAIRQMSSIIKTNPEAKLEIVLFGQSLNMVIKDKSVVAEDVRRLLENKNVSFKVCEVTMDRFKINKSQLIEGVGTVPDGIYEIITKQRQGWGYIKIAQ